MNQKLVWQYLSEARPQTLEQLQSVLLANRRITHLEDFLSPPPPMVIPTEAVGLAPMALQTVVARLRQAIEKQEKVLIFGDYDVDGVCATAILWEALKSQGLVATPFIPHRLKHGYGLSVAALEEIWAEQPPDLVVTVDNGIVAHPALAWLQAKHVPVLVTDHHQPDGKKLAALAILHSTQISGAAISWFVARELSLTVAESQLDLLCLATLADQMPLKGCNRAFVWHGMVHVNQTKRVGLQALKAIAGVEGELTSQSVQFSLIPRLNAMGRLEHGLASLRLVCVKSPQMAQQLAEVLQTTNQARQQLTVDLQQLAHTQTLSQEQEALLIVHSPQFHEGVIGLLAGKLMEEHYKPVIALHVGKQTSKASVRSIPGFNIVEFLRAQPLPYLELGGHALAAGFVLANELLPTALTQLQQAAQLVLTPALLQPKLQLEASISINLVTTALGQFLTQLQPFGQGNPAPVFGFEQVQVVDVQTMGSEQQHARLTVQDAQGLKIQAIYWRHGTEVQSLHVGQQISLAARVENNTWKGRVRQQLVVVDLHV